LNAPKYDTFFSYHADDRPLVESLAEQLRAEGITVWLDTSDLAGGTLWQSELEKALERSSSCCVFVGKSGLGLWQTEETRVAIDRRVHEPDAFRVIPVILPGVDRQSLRKLPKLLTASMWIELSDTFDMTESLHRLARVIREEAFDDPSSYQPLGGPSHAAQSVEGSNLSWAQEALRSDVIIQFLFGALHSPPPRQPELSHYVAALIEKYCYLLPPLVSTVEHIYITKARRTLIENGCVFGRLSKRDSKPDNVLNLMVSTASNIPKSFPSPHFWIGTSQPAQLQESIHFHRCDVNLALIRILVHCAAVTRRDEELEKDLLCLPIEVRYDVKHLVALFSPVVVAPPYKLMDLPRVQEATRAGLAILFPTGREGSESNESDTVSMLSQTTEALRNGDLARVKRLRKLLRKECISIRDTEMETALANIDVSIAIVEGDDASAETILRDLFQRANDQSAGCNLALLLSWLRRFGEAQEILERLEIALLSAPQALLVKIIGHWVSHNIKPENRSHSEKVVESLAGELRKGTDVPALLWHVLSAAGLDLGLIDMSIHCAEKATHLDSTVLEYKIQHATALLCRFPSTPPDYQRREPFPIRDYEPKMARSLLEGLVSDSSKRTDRFVGTVQHLLGIAYYSLGIATSQVHDRQEWFLRSGEAFSIARQKTNSDLPHLAGYAGQAFLRAREFRRACSIIEAIPLENRSKSSETALIVALAMDDRVADAVSEVNLALRQNVLSSEALANLAMLVLQCGLPDDAKRLLKLAIPGLARSSWIVHFLLGRAHIDLGEFESAEQELWRSISLNSTEPHLYTAHLLAFNQSVARKARALLLEVQRRAQGIKAETGFLIEFERRVSREVEVYHEHVKRLNAFTVSGSTVIAKSFETIRRSIGEFRKVVIALDKLLQDTGASDAEAFLATVRGHLGATTKGESDYVETLPPSESVINGEHWIALQRTLSQDSSWVKAGLRLNDSGADILAHISNTSQQSFVSHWLHLAARHVDVEARAKKLRAYSQTQGVERKPYQEAVVRRAKLQNYGRIILADEVGLGKTIEACLILSEYRERGLVKRCLILVPSRELGQQWERELIDKFQLRRESNLELGRYRASGWSGLGGHEVCILTYQAALANAQAVIEEHWDMVICDEAHHLTNRESGRFKLLKALRNRVPYLLLLTATPMQRRVDDLYSLAQLIRPSMFPTLKEFRERYCDAQNPRQIRHAGDLVRRLSEIMVRNRAGAVSSEVLLGRRLFNDLNVSLDQDEREFYEAVETLVFKAYKPTRLSRPPLAYYSLARAASSSPMAALKWIESLTRDQLVSSEAKELLDFARQLQPTSKLRELRNLLSLRSNEEHVIIFTDYRTTAHCIANSVGGILVDSRLTDRQLRERLDAFRAGHEGRILVATPRLSEGLNLQFCHNVVNFDLPWNPFKIEQRIGRVHRVGQRSPEVFISTLSSSDTIEQLIKEFLQSKLRMFESVVGRMTHQIFEFDSGGTIEEQIKGILARVENRKQLRRELDGLSFAQPILTHDPEINKPPKPTNITLYLDHAWDRFSRPNDND